MQWKSYEITFGREALSRLHGQVPLSCFECIRAALDDLRSDPTELGSRCEFPYRGCKQYEFECKTNSHGFLFRAHFFFEENETHIQVFDVMAIANW